MKLPDRRVTAVTWIVLGAVGLVTGCLVVFTVTFFALVVPHGGIW